MKFSFTTVAASVLALISACTTTPVSTVDAVDVPMSRVLDPSVMSRQPNDGAILVKRDSGVFGIGCAHRIHVDGKPTVDIRTSEKFTINLPEGEHMIGVGGASAVCGGSSSVNLEVKATVRPNVTQVLRTGVSASGSQILGFTAY